MSNSDFVSPNARRWLNLISFAEGTYGKQGPRYDITFGYRPIKDLSKHPDQVVRSGGYSSAAAGAYQFMPGTWQRAAQAVKASDFGPRSQDLAALQLMRWRGVDPDKAPISPETVAKLSGEWASFPTLKGVSAYGQPAKSYEQLAKFAQSQGATVVPQGTGSTAASSGTDAESALAQALLGSYLGSLLSKQPSDDYGYKAPEVAHSSYDESEESDGLSSEDVQTLLSSLSEANRPSYSDTYLRDSGRSLSDTQQRMAQLLQSAQSAFKPGTPVI